MLPSFEHVGHAYELTFHRRSSGAPLRLDFHSARRLLSTPMGQPSGMRRLRAVLSTATPVSAVARMTDAEVVHSLADGIASRRIHIYVEALRTRVAVLDAEAPAEEALGPLPEAAVEEVAEETVDVPAQVEALLQAAKDGVPFCEECEKARLAQQASLAESAPDDAAGQAPSPYDGVDVPSQVAALTQASAAGVPFCEECEKARLAELAQQQDAPEQQAAQAAGPEEAEVDVPAQAAALTQASAAGVPFCEECEKARQAAAADAGNAGGAS